MIISVLRDDSPIHESFKNWAIIRINEENIESMDGGRELLEQAVKLKRIKLELQKL